MSYLRSHNSTVKGYTDVLQCFHYVLLCKMASCCVGSTNRDLSRLNALVAFSLCFGWFRNGRISTLQAFFAEVCPPPGIRHLRPIPPYQGYGDWPPWRAWMVVIYCVDKFRLGETIAVGFAECLWSGRLTGYHFLGRAFIDDSCVFQLTKS